LNSVQYDQCSPTPILEQMSLMSRIFLIELICLDLIGYVFTSTHLQIEKNQELLLC